MSAGNILCSAIELLGVLHAPEMFDYVFGSYVKFRPNIKIKNEFLKTCLDNSKACDLCLRLAVCEVPFTCTRRRHGI